MLAKIAKRKRTNVLVDAQLAKFCLMRDNIVDIWTGFMQVIREADKCPKVRGERERKRKFNMISKKFCLTYVLNLKCALFYILYEVI